MRCEKAREISSCEGGKSGKLESTEGKERGVDKKMLKTVSKTVGPGV